MESETELQHHVIDELKWEPSVTPAASDCLRHLSGVINMSDHLAIKPTASFSVVESGIEAALTRNASDDARKITLEPNGAERTLKGTMHVWVDRERTTISAWEKPGVPGGQHEMTSHY